ncbi:hypothetical protein H6F88_25135 [Oculatella sp. FACHB-28]|uniref:hypothetical protein n=1 Tax=Oculatella sp. FACHB-28 TaxID=2692845 RepID=UPI0016837790|nr:hypothetical protein [Oculatella sp. FACHB-28]MBD2059239.1 hypothetical protein [Oculatella sp. FACHB-28]
MVSFRLLPALISISLTLPLGTASAQLTPENEAALLREMLRLRYASEGEENVQILVGQLPDPLPADFPLPEEAQIIGSIVRSYGFTEIMLRTAQSSEEVYSFFQQQLLDTGWQLQEPHASPKGFIVRLSEAHINDLASRELPRQFCSTSQAALLNVSAQPSPDSSATTVQLSLIAGGFESEPSSGFNCSLGIVEAPLPALLPPTNAVVQGSGSSSGNGDASADAVIETDLDAEALINHYASQLQQAGWRQIEASERGLSRWSYQDEEGRDWQGSLLITEIQGTPNQYAASIQILRRSLNDG